MPEESTPFFIAAGLCWLLALLAWLGCRRACRRYNAIFEVPTIAARDIPGLGAASVEVNGVAEADEPLLSDLVRVPCVAFTCAVTEHWTTTRVVTDSKGKSRTVTQHHTETRYSNSAEIAFRVRDESGAAVVQPAGACIEMLNTLTDVREPQRGSPVYGISPKRFGGRLSFSETALPVGCKVYVLGQVGEDYEIRQPQYCDRPFIISYRTEAQLLNSARWGLRIWGTVAVVLFIGGFVAVGLLLEQRSPRVRRAAPEYRQPVPASPAPPLPRQAEEETSE